jgi:hypothetical protein
MTEAMDFANNAYLSTLFKGNALDIVSGSLHAPHTNESALEKFTDDIRSLVTGK